jgi:RPA family protein
MAENQIKRAVAYKVPISLILRSNYVKDEGEFSPNFLEFRDMKVSRVNLIGAVIAIENINEANRSILLDDGTGGIAIRGFEQNTIPTDVSIGDIVNIIGRPREYGSERYVLPEIVKKISQKWMLIRKQELKEYCVQDIEDKEINQQQEPLVEDIIEESTPGALSKRNKIIEFIKGNDPGSGVDIEIIIQNCQIESCEQLIEDMLKEGDLFENLPGKVRILE